MLKKGDIILVLTLAGIIVLSFAGLQVYKKFNNAGTGKIAVIRQNDKVIKKIDLDKVSEPQRIEVKGDYVDVVLVEKGRIRFEEANCPDLVCVKSGWMSRKGDMAVCLPNRVSVRIEGTDPSVDGVAF